MGANSSVTAPANGISLQSLSPSTNRFTPLAAIDEQDDISTGLEAGELSDGFVSSVIQTFDMMSPISASPLGVTPSSVTGISADHMYLGIFTS